MGTMDLKAVQLHLEIIAGSNSRDILAEAASVLNKYPTKCAGPGRFAERSRTKWSNNGNWRAASLRWGRKGVSITTPVIEYGDQMFVTDELAKILNVEPGII